MNKRSLFLISLTALLCCSLFLFSPMQDKPFSQVKATNAAQNLTDEPGEHSEAFTAMQEPEEKQKESTHKEKMEVQIEKWIKALTSEKEFEEWKKAQWDIHPMGPGMHSWIILLHNHEAEVGYLIVGPGEEEGSFKLLEYGIGSFPLFSFNTLHSTLVNHHLIEQTLSEVKKITALYNGPFQAVWEILEDNQHYYFDAKTGERYDMLNQELEWLHTYAPTGENGNEETTLVKSMKGDIFDPFEKLNWVGQPPVSISSLNDLIYFLESGKQLTFTARIFMNAVTSPYAATGFHHWTSDIAFVRVEQDGARFIPLAEFRHFGEFYPERSETRP